MKTIRLPSGDQEGARSSSRFWVRRMGLPLRSRRSRKSRIHGIVRIVRDGVAGENDLGTDGRPIRIVVDRVRVVRDVNLPAWCSITSSTFAVKMSLSAVAAPGSGLIGRLAPMPKRGTQCPCRRETMTPSCPATERLLGAFRIHHEKIRGVSGLLRKTQAVALKHDLFPSGDKDGNPSPSLLVVSRRGFVPSGFIR